MYSKPQIGLVLSAAGKSSRHPGKLLQQVDGVPCLQRSLRQALQVAQHVVVVLGHRGAEIQTWLETLPELQNLADRIHIQLCSNWNEGLAASIRCGIEHLPSCHTIALLNGDRCFIKTESLQQMLQTLVDQKPQILCPRWSGNPDAAGHPLFLDAAFRDELLKLEGDVGARLFLKQHASQCLNLLLDDPGLLQDMDQYLAGSSQ